MKIDDIKDLEKVIKLCRKTGVSSITIDGVTIELGDAPITYQEPKNVPQKSQGFMPTTPGISYTPSEDTPIPTPDLLTPEQLLFYSVQGEGQ